MVYSGEGALVIKFIEGQTLAERDIRDRCILARILQLLKACHNVLPQHLRGPTLVFWVFHVLRETLWSLVSEVHSTIDFDYITYSEENLARFEAAWAEAEV